MLSLSYSVIIYVYILGEIPMAVDYKELKKGGFMRQRQKDHFSMRLKSVGGQFTAAQLGTCL